MDNAPPPAGGDWPARAADLIDAVVAVVRDKAVRPVALAARALVFGIIVLMSSLLMTIVLSIALVRILTVYAFSGRVWLSDLVVGAVFVLLGLGAWSKRRAPASQARAR